MERKIIITKQDSYILTSVWEDGRIVEIHGEEEDTGEKQIQLGNIYIGRVKNIVHSIQAAFIEVQPGVECYYSIAENPSPIFTRKQGKKPLCIGDELVVQVSKEAVKTKIPTVSSQINFAGKYAVLTTGDTRIGVSKKIPQEQRENLKERIRMHQNSEYGIILRTNAMNAETSVLDEEVSRLIEEYHRLVKTAQTRVVFSCLKRAQRPYLSDLKNINQAGLSEILVEDPILYEEIAKYLHEYQPEDIGKLCLYQDSLLPLHKLYSIEKHLQDALKERVWMKSGAYLVIQPTEALTVIDVNTGKCVGKKKEDSFCYKINLEAAKESARQIRLRNLSGIIIIDFINLSDSELVDELLDAFRKELNKDSIATTLVGMTRLQLVELTRKKVRRPLHEVFRYIRQ